MKHFMLDSTLIVEPVVMFDLKSSELGVGILLNCEERSRPAYNPYIFVREVRTGCFRVYNVR